MMNTRAQIHLFPAAGPEAPMAELLTASFVPPSAGEPLDGFLADIAISLWLLREEQAPHRKSA